MRTQYAKDSYARTSYAKDQDDSRLIVQLAFVLVCIHLLTLVV